MNNKLKYLSTFIVIAFLSFTAFEANAQDQYRYSANRLGLHGAVNWNFTGTGYQNFPQTAGTNFEPFIVEDGQGIGPYFGVNYEYLSKDWWGLQFRLSYDDRTLTDVTEVRFGPDYTYDFNVSYLTFEPMFRIDQDLIPSLHMVAGPMIAYNINATMNGNTPNGSFNDVEIPDFREVTWGLSGGFGYDIFLDDESDGQRWVLTPFVEGSWMVDQRPKTEPVAQDKIDDVWSTATARFGIKMSSEWLDIEEVAVAAEEQTINLSLTTPAGGYIRQRMIEDYFSLIPYVFFNEGSQQIPNRYATLSSSQASNFSEQDLLTSAEIKNLPSGKYPNHQMRVYYNILNIYGDRLRRNPGVNVTLYGSAPNANDGQVLASKVKDYLVNNFGIASSRITLQEGERPPSNPSGDSGTPKEDWPLAQQENRRVTFAFSDNSLNEPVAMRLVETSMVDNDLVLNVDTRNIQNWKVDIVGHGNTLTYGPFYYDVQRIDASYLMDNLDEGTYTANVTVNTADGKTITTQKRFNLVKQVYDDGKEIGRRHTLTFQFNDTAEIEPYSQFIRDELAPQIPEGNRVIVHGHTDVIGVPERNLNLSVSRAQTARNILKDAFDKAGKNIQVDAYGFGESELHTFFPNDLPEGRQYNRNVIIEIIPINQ